MEIAFATIADAANVTHDHRVNILGMRDTFRVRKFPAILSQFVLVFGVRGEHEDVGKDGQIRISLIDADSRKLWAGAANLALMDAKPGDFSHLQNVMEFRGIRFERSGRFRFRIEVTGSDRPYDVVFQVVQAPGGR